MDLFAFLEYLRQFNVDVLVIGVAVWGLTELLKNTLLKKVDRKYLTFVPFVLGALLYAAYAACTGGFAAGAAAVGGVIAEGMTCGAVATVIHIVCERLGGKGEVSVRAACVQALLADYAAVTAEQAEALAAAFEREAEEEAMSLLSDLVGESAAQALYPLLERTLHTL